MKTRITIALLFLFALTLAACAPAASAPTMAPAATAAPMASANQYSLASGRAPESPPSEPSAAIQRLVIKNADMIIVVDNPAGSMAAIMEMANQMGGYVVSSKSYKTKGETGEEVPQANVEVRVPAEKLDDALTQIRKLTNDPVQDIRSENISGQDVTADYVDLQSRLTSLQNTADKLTNIMDSATKTEDVLNVFNQLTSIQQQIEQLKGQIKYYEESAALSSITVQLLAQSGIAPISIGGWQPIGVVRDAFQALINVGKFLVNAVIWLLILFVPIGLVFFFPVRWGVKAFRKWRKNRKANTSANVPPYPPTSASTPQYPEIK